MDRERVKERKEDREKERRKWAVNIKEKKKKKKKKKKEIIECGVDKERRKKWQRRVEKRESRVGWIEKE